MAGYYLIYQIHIFNDYRVDIYNPQSILTTKFNNYFTYKIIKKKRVYSSIYSYPIASSNKSHSYFAYLFKLSDKLTKSFIFILV